MSEIFKPRENKTFHKIGQITKKNNISLFQEKGIVVRLEDDLNTIFHGIKSIRLSQSHEKLYVAKTVFTLESFL